MLKQVSKVETGEHPLPTNVHDRPNPRTIYAWTVPLPSLPDQTVSGVNVHDRRKVDREVPVSRKVITLESRR